MHDFMAPLYLRKEKLPTCIKLQLKPKWESGWAFWAELGFGSSLNALGLVYTLWSR